MATKSLALPKPPNAPSVTIDARSVTDVPVMLPDGRVVPGAVTNRTGQWALVTVYGAFQQSGNTVYLTMFATWQQVADCASSGKPLEVTDS